MFTYKIDHPTIYGEIFISDKFTFIEGPSGAGKTYLAWLHDELEKANLLNHVECGRYVYDLQSRDNEISIQSAIISHPGCLFMCDESAAGRLVKFVKNSDCYALVVTRRSPSYVSNSYKSVYLAERTDRRTRITRKFTNLHIPNTFICDSFITEDSRAGYQFVKKWISPAAIPAGGKDNISDLMTPDLIGPYIHVIFDAGGVSGTLSDIQDAKEELESCGYRVSLWAPECFEELMLGAGFIDFDGNIPGNYGSKYPTTEKFCEDKIKELTAGTKYEYTHKGGYKTNCWLQDCTGSCGGCNEVVRGSKRAAVLQSGPLPQLLRIKQQSFVPLRYNFDFDAATDWCLKHPHEVLSIPPVSGVILQSNTWQVVKRGDNYFFIYSSTRSTLISLAITNSGYYMPHGFSYSKLEPLLRNYAGVKPAPFD